MADHPLLALSQDMIVSDDDDDDWTDEEDGDWVKAAIEPVVALYAPGGPMQRAMAANRVMAPADAAILDNFDKSLGDSDLSPQLMIVGCTQTTVFRARVSLTRVLISPVGAGVRMLS